MLPKSDVFFLMLALSYLLQIPASIRTILNYQSTKLSWAQGHVLGLDDPFHPISGTWPTYA